MRYTDAKCKRTIPCGGRDRDFDIFYEAHFRLNRRAEVRSAIPKDDDGKPTLAHVGNVVVLVASLCVM